MPTPKPDQRAKVSDANFMQTRTSNLNRRLASGAINQQQYQNRLNRAQTNFQQYQASQPKPKPGYNGDVRPPIAVPGKPPGTNPGGFPQNPRPDQGFNRERPGYQGDVRIMPMPGQGFDPRTVGPRGGGVSGVPGIGAQGGRFGGDVRFRPLPGRQPVQIGGARRPGYQGDVRVKRIGGMPPQGKPQTQGRPVQQGALRGMNRMGQRIMK